MNMNKDKTILIATGAGRRGLKFNQRQGQTVCTRLFLTNKRESHGRVLSGETQSALHFHDTDCSMGVGLLGKSRLKIWLAMGVNKERHVKDDPWVSSMIMEDCSIVY